MGFNLIEHGGLSLTENNMQTMLILMLCYGICAAQTGVVLYRRKAYAYEVITRVVKNVIYFTLLSGVILLAGRFIRYGNRHTYYMY